MAMQGRREALGQYQFGIYAVERVGRGKWEAHATGPGTLGSGHIGTFPTLDAAHKQLTGESLHD